MSELPELKEQLTQIKRKGERLSQEVKKQTVGYIVAALGLVAGLAWNDAIKSIIDQYVEVGRNTVLAKFIYAAFITIVIVTVSMFLLRLINKENK